MVWLQWKLNRKFYCRRCIWPVCYYCWCTCIWRAVTVVHVGCC